MASLTPSTTNVSGTTPAGTGWTVNVAPANLNDNLTEKDFEIRINGLVNSNNNWDKTSRTVLTYTGPAVTAGLSLEIRRKTPPNLLTLAEFGERISSQEYNNEFERRARIDYEIVLNSGGGGGGGLPPLDDAFGVLWNGDITYAPTRNAVYDWGVGLAPLANPAFTGNPTAPTQAPGNNSTRLATTAFINTALTSYAPLASPVFTGNPTAPSQALDDYSTRLVNTQWVVDRLASNPILGTLATATTQLITDNSTRLATTAFAHLASVIRRIESATATGVYTHSSTVAATIPGCSITITPRSTASRFLVIAVGSIVNGSSNVRVPTTTLRNTTAGTTFGLSTGSGYDSGNTITVARDMVIGINSPASTAAQTFVAQAACNAAVSLDWGQTASPINNLWQLFVIEFANTL